MQGSQTQGIDGVRSLPQLAKTLSRRWAPCWASRVTRLDKALEHNIAADVVALVHQQVGVCKVVRLDLALACALGSSEGRQKCGLFAQPRIIPEALHGIKTI